MAGQLDAEEPAKEKKLKGWFRTDHSYHPSDGQSERTAGEPVKHITMKLLLLLVTLLILHTGNAQQRQPGALACLSKNRAETILGQPATLTENAAGKKHHVDRYTCTYTAVSRDARHKLGNLYYVAEAYLTPEDAHRALAAITSANRDMPGWKKFSDGVDEGVSHTDGTNFQLVIVRKGNKLVRLKINQVTDFTKPIDSLQSIARTIIRDL